MEQTPNWKTASPSMSTSISDTHANGLHTNDSLKLVEERAAGWHEADMQISTRASAAENMAKGHQPRQRSESKTSLKKTKRKRQTSRSTSRPVDPWEFPSSSPLEFDRGDETTEAEPKRVKRDDPARDATELELSKIKSMRGRRGVLDDLNDEDLADWEPGRRLKILEEPANPRVTRRSGSIGLLNGLNKRKRGRLGTADAESESATEVSVGSKRSNKKKRSAAAGPTSDSSILVDLAKPEVILSESQKEEYEQLSVEASSVECPPRLVHLMDEEAYEDPFADYPDLSSTIPNTNSYAGEPRSTGFFDASSAAVKEDPQSLRDETVEKAGESSGAIVGSRDCHLGVSGEEQGRAILIARSEESDHRRQQSIPLNEGSTKDIESNPKNDDEEEEEKERIKPSGPPRKRRKSKHKEVQVMSGGSSNQPLTTDRTLQEVDHNEAPLNNHIPAATVATAPTTPDQATASKAAAAVVDLVSCEVETSNESRAVTTTGATGHHTAKLSALPPPSCSSLDDKRKTGPSTAATAVSGGGGHSPLHHGRVPYRVGLSKRVRIQPLLRVMKR